MISVISFQEEIIDALAACADLTALVDSDEIREYQYQGTEFAYPCVRVDVRNQVPEGDAPCRLTISIINFAVLAYSEEESSRECERVCYQIVECLFGTQIEMATPVEGPDWRTETVNLVQINAPRRMAEKVWRGEVIFRCRVKETTQI